MASRGSVIPLFVKLIKSNQPLTITDPNMTRYLMTLSESVDLVMHALQKRSEWRYISTEATSSNN